jgi:hypothetical protein
MCGTTMQPSDGRVACEVRRVPWTASAAHAQAAGARRPPHATPHSACTQSSPATPPWRRCVQTLIPAHPVSAPRGWESSVGPVRRTISLRHLRDGVPPAASRRVHGPSLDCCTQSSAQRQRMGVGHYPPEWPGRLATWTLVLRIASRLLGCSGVPEGCKRGRHDGTHSDADGSVCLSRRWRRRDADPLPGRAPVAACATMATTAAAAAAAAAGASAAHAGAGGCARMRRC